MPGRNGPHNYWSEDALPSRGQWKTIAELALELLDEPLPLTRLGASLTIGTLRASLEPVSPPLTVPTSNGISRTSGATPGPDGMPASVPGAPGVSTVAGRASGSSRVSRTGVRTAASTPTPAG